MKDVVVVVLREGSQLGKQGLQSLWMLLHLVDGAMD